MESQRLFGEGFSFISGPAGLERIRFLLGSGWWGLLLLFGCFLAWAGVSDGQVFIQGPAWPNTWENFSNFGTVFMTLFKNVMLFKVVEFTPQYGWIGGIVLIMTRLIIPLQAALFAFALRNRFRR